MLLPRTLLVIVSALVLSLSFTTQAFAGTGGGNVGMVHGFTNGTTYDYMGNSVGYTCNHVHRTRVAGGFQDKQTCQLADNAVLPKQMVTVDYGSNSWASDYILSRTNWKTWQIAAYWSQRFQPSGVVEIVSFYPTAP